MLSIPKTFPTSVAVAAAAVGLAYAYSSTLPILNFLIPLLFSIIMIFLFRILPAASVFPEAVDYTPVNQKDSFSDSTLLETVVVSHESDDELLDLHNDGCKPGSDDDDIVHDSVTTAALSPQGSFRRQASDDSCFSSPSQSEGGIGGGAEHSFCSTSSRVFDESNADAVVLCFLDLADLSSVHSDHILQAVGLMEACDIPTEDICVVLAYGSVYVNDLAKQCAGMSDREASYIACLLLYLAHSYVHDQTCSLRSWHRHLFKDYCDLGVLNKAILNLMKMRGYVLRVDDCEIQERLARLLACADEPAPMSCTIVVDM
jgi:hypothetical protein